MSGETDAPRSLLPALAFEDALGNFEQIGSDDTWSFDEWIEYHAGTGDKGRRAANSQGLPRLEMWRESPHLAQESIFYLPA
jgi:hypothetical protein